MRKPAQLADDPVEQKYLVHCRNVYSHDVWLDADGAWTKSRSDAGEFSYREAEKLIASRIRAVRIPANIKKVPV